MRICLIFHSFQLSCILIFFIIILKVNSLSFASHILNLCLFDRSIDRRTNSIITIECPFISVGLLCCLICARLMFQTFFGCIPYQTRILLLEHHSIYRNLWPSTMSCCLCLLIHSDKLNLIRMMCEMFILMPFYVNYHTSSLSCMYACCWMVGWLVDGGTFDTMPRNRLVK